MCLNVFYTWEEESKRSAVMSPVQLSMLQEELALFSARRKAAIHTWDTGQAAEESFTARDAGHSLSLHGKEQKAPPHRPVVPDRHLIALWESTTRADRNPQKRFLVASDHDLDQPTEVEFLQFFRLRQAGDNIPAHRLIIAVQNLVEIHHLALADAVGGRFFQKPLG